VEGPQVEGVEVAQVAQEGVVEGVASQKEMKN